MKAIQIILILLLSILVVNAKELEKVSVQLQWLDQFQFAGYYMAKEKGFYEDVGLDVEIKKYKKGLKTIDEVTSKRTTYGVGRPALIIDRSKGKKIVLLSALFQSSPLVLLARKDSNISSVKDFIGKTIMATFDDTSVASIEAMLTRHNIHKSELNIIPYSYNINDLIDGKTDLMTAYITNQAYRLKELGIEYNIFDPTDYDFDVNFDLLFTTEDELKNHHHRSENFRDATLKGWEYAFNHIDETVALIKAKYNSQNKSIASLKYEAEESKKLAYFNTKDIGIIEPAKIQRIYDMYNIMGLVNDNLDLEKFIFKKHKHGEVALSYDEQEYLNNNKDIKYTGDPNWLPFEAFDEDGKYIGIVSEHLNILEHKLNIKFDKVVSKDWEDALKIATSGMADVISGDAADVILNKQFIPIDAYISSPIVIIMKDAKKFVSKLKELKDKKIAVIKDYGYTADIFKLYPDIDFVQVKNIQDGLSGVNSSKYDVLLASLPIASYSMSKYNFTDLKIVGSTRIKMDVTLFVNKKKPVLHSILNKAIHSIDNDIHEDILMKYREPRSKSIDYKLVLEIITLFIVIIVIILFFLFKQNRLKRRIESLNFKLNQKISSQVLEIKKSTKMFESIFNTVKDGIAILDLESNFLLVNNAYINMTGFSKEELYSTSCINITVPEMVEKSKKAVSCVIEKGYYGGYEKQCIVKDGRVIDVVIDIILMDDKKTILMVTKDITRQKEYEREKKLQEKQLFHQSKLAQMGEMISMIAHQWRQPLGAISATSIDIKIKMELELYDLEDKQDRAKFQKYLNDSLDNIESLTQNLTTTIDDFRDFYKKNKIPKALRIDKPIQKALNIVRDSLKTSNIDLVEEYNSTKIVDIFDGEIMQVILNILKNAQDNFAIKEIQNATIKIVTFDSDDGVSFSICDNGGGIGHAIIDKIFEPYFSTKEEKNGTGLGLYMSKMIIEEHHTGSLSVQNSDGGVCFKIVLPNGEQS